jgi:hypothetical protein
VTFFCRAAHVDVDHRGTGVLRKARRFRHDIAAGDLHHRESRSRALCFQPVGGIGAGVVTGGDHFRNGKIGAARETAHAEVDNPAMGARNARPSIWSPPTWKAVPPALRKLSARSVMPIS